MSNINSIEPVDFIGSIDSINPNPLQIIDITNINEQTADKLLNAATTQGFLMVEGHEFKKDEVEKLFKISKEFFELPDSYKLLHLIDNSNHGYTSYGGENLNPSNQLKGDPKEAFNISCLNFLTGDSNKELPSWFYEDLNRIELVKKTIKKLYNITIKIFKLLAIGLKIEDTDDCKGINWFSLKHEPTKVSGSTFRFLHYPGQKTLNPESTIRAGAHTDYGSITLLFQKENEEGLEIYSPVTKKWDLVPFVSATCNTPADKAPPIIVNIADQLSYWTAGLLKSTLHRVKFPIKFQESGRSRYSIVFFSHPNDITLLEPIPSPLTRSIKNRGANEEKKYLTAKEHLDKRLAATYKW